MRVKNPWYKYAKEDYKTIKVLAGKKLTRSVLFHAQQFVEKTIKGIIYEKDDMPPKTHELVVLFRKGGITLKEFDLEYEEVQFLNSVYIETRYPPDFGLLPGGEPSEEDEKYAIQIVDKFYKKMEIKLSKQ